MERVHPALAHRSAVHGQQLMDGGEPKPLEVSQVDDLNHVAVDQVAERSNSLLAFINIMRQLGVERNNRRGARSRALGRHPPWYG